MAQERERRPVIRSGELESPEGLRHHAHNLERRSVHPDRAVDDGRIARVMPRPRAMAEDDDRRAAGFVVQWCERAPAYGADSENLEEVSRDEPTLPPHALDPRVNIRRRRESGGEHGRLAKEPFIFEARGEGIRLRRRPVAGDRL